MRLTPPRQSSYWASAGDPNTAILNVWLDGDGVRQFEFVPAIVQYGGQPRLADTAEAADIRAHIYRLSRGFPLPVVDAD